MKISGWEIVGIKNIQSGIFKLENERTQDWVVKPMFGPIGKLDSDNIFRATVIIEAFYCKELNDARVAISTEFDIQLVNGEKINMVSEESYKLFAELSSIAVSHARAYFNILVEGAIFSDSMVPHYDYDFLYDHVKTEIQKVWN